MEATRYQALAVMRRDVDVKRWIIAATIAMLPAGALGQWEPPSEVLVIKARGEGPWTVRCKLQDKGGATVTRDIVGRGKGWQQLTMFDARGGQCSYQAAPDKPLEITKRGGLYGCPLATKTRKGGCEQTIPAGGSGQFEVKRRDLAT